MMSENAKLYHILSWVCLFLGWGMGLTILAFPLGIYLASQAMEGGVDAALVRKLNFWSLIAVVIMILLAVSLVLIFVAA
ncbi:hypothetical protein ACO1PF_05040 [Alkalibacterium sp. f15]|uniref:hypothetical protein n=1 Tax=Alkalibacterium sp. f15 TaxID=3414029 RepID=UPI003BF7A361